MVKSLARNTALLDKHGFSVSRKTTSRCLEGNTEKYSGEHVITKAVKLTFWNQGLWQFSQKGFEKTSNIVEIVPFLKRGNLYDTTLMITLMTKMVTN